MKQLAFMIVMTLAGTVGVYVITPFLGVAVYYLFAVLRPHYMWQWSLPADVQWSFFVAVATIGAVAAAWLGLVSVPAGPGAPNDGRRKLSPVHTWMLLFAVWIAVTYLTAQNRQAAYPWFFEYVKIFLMFAVSSYLVRTVRQVWVLFVLTALALGYIAYEVNYLYLANNYLGIYRSGYGGLDNNGAGLMLAMGVPLCWFAYEGMRKWWRWGFVLLIPVLMHAVLMTYSRGAMVSLLGMSPLLVMRSRHRVRLGLFLLGLALVALPVMVGPEIQARFLTINKYEVDESANQRRAAWAAAWQMAKDHPLFGVGVRNAGLFSHLYGADKEGRTIHSQYLQVAADNGFVGLALFLTLLVAGWLSTRRCRRAVAGREDPEACRIRAIACGVECAMAVYCIGSVFLSLEVFELPYLLLLLAAQLPLVSGALAQPEDPDPRLAPAAVVAWHPQDL
jgi:probable O-glycosylation ligase (exosortase A-associated)